MAQSRIEYFIGVVGGEPSSCKEIDCDRLMHVIERWATTRVFNGDVNKEQLVFTKHIDGFRVTVKLLHDPGSKIVAKIATNAVEEFYPVPHAEKLSSAYGIIADIIEAQSRSKLIRLCREFVSYSEVILR